MCSLTTYMILNMCDVVIYSVFYFTSEEKAREWAKHRGYNIVKDAKDDNDVTIELISFEA